MSARSSVTVACAVAVLAAACGNGDCVPVSCAAVACLDPFSLTVTDAATAMPIDDATASGDVACSTTSTGVACDAGGAGVFSVTVSAPGHASSRVSVTVQPGVAGTECSCPRCATWQPTSVALSAQ